MKISIITPCYNSAQTIEGTIQSVLSQTHRDIEYIVIDGGSRDGTLDILHKYKDHISVIVSEKDSGLYDAMNKGISRATGDVVGILNSDDFYASHTVLSEVARVFEDTMFCVCYGDLVYVDRCDISRILRTWKAGEYDEKKIMRGWAPPHPSFFVRRDVYKDCGNFRTDFSIASDYEFMLRVLCVHKCLSAYVPRTFVCMRQGGISSGTITNRLKGIREIYRAWKVNHLSPPIFLYAFRFFNKLFTQYR